MKGSYTVEAALVFPFVCIILCMSITVTLSLYEKVSVFGTEAANRLCAMKGNPETLRMERLIFELGQE